jgi:hypothetical protein
MLYSRPVPAAENPEVFQARLAPMPADAGTAPSLRGGGSVTARFDGKILTISGEFSGFTSAATLAHVHRGVPGVRGPVAFDLAVTSDTRGSVTGTVPLTSAQAGDLRKGWYYVQIHSKTNADGQVRGWLLKK